MIAIDTNVLVRLLTEDDPEQAVRAKTVFDTEDVFIPTTVWLEAEWVLRSLLGFPRNRIIDTFADVAGLAHIYLEDGEKLTRALAWARDGLDFADALHLAASQHCEAMATFDRSFQRRGSVLSAVPVREA